MAPTDSSSSIVIVNRKKQLFLNCSTLKLVLSITSIMIIHDNCVENHDLTKKSVICDTELEPFLKMIP